MPRADRGLINARLRARARARIEYFFHIDDLSIAIIAVSRRSETITEKQVIYCTHK